MQIATYPYRLAKTLKTWLYTSLSLLLFPQLRKTGVRVNGFSRLSRVFVGPDCHFNQANVYGKGKVTIGKSFHSAKGLEIYTTFHNYEGNGLPYDSSEIHKDVTIGDYVWLGANVTILGGVKIGNGAIVQARSVVCKDIPPLAIAGGHPAVPFRYRDKQHYEKWSQSE